MTEECTHRVVHDLGMRHAFKLVHGWPKRTLARDACGLQCRRCLSSWLWTCIPRRSIPWTEARAVC
jgi:hypothetical protein